MLQWGYESASKANYSDMLWLASYLFPSYQLEVRGASHVKFHWLAKLSVLGLVLQKMVDL